MFRGTTGRRVLAVLTAVLLALPFFACAPSFAQAHTARHAEAKARPASVLPVTAPREETVASRDCGHLPGPADPLRPRDRQRTADSAPQAPERPLSAPDPAAPRPSAAGSAPLHSPRPAPAPTPAALQVFRC
ncbi:hypothetical protein AB0E88_06240 [Streptomyces sp. NPDC028635]|uniref:hypothetical protein n=1 Tax=Streptomyces sp. NPDC028635 TaxID=3154800 RepID=UPI0033CCA593